MKNKKTKETVSMPMLSTRAELQPESINDESRTVDLIFSTGAQVNRGGFFSEPFIEELSLEKDHVRLERLNNSAPLLKNHSNRELTDVLGVVLSASVDGNVGRATVKFSERADVEPIFQDVKAGILRHISVGYRVHKFEKVGEQDGVSILRGVDWEPLEVSSVPIGADDGAVFRGENAEQNTCTIVGVAKEIEMRQDDQSHETTEIENENEKPVDTAENLRQDTHDDGVSEMTKEEIAQAKRDAKAAEKTRQKEINFSVRAAGLESSVAEQYIDDDKSIDEVRGLIIDALAEKNKENETRSTHTAEVLVDERDTRKAGLTESLLHRANPNNTLTDNGRQYRYMSLLDMAKTCLEQVGVRTAGLSKMQVAGKALEMRGAHSISDFPEILANVAGKSLRDSFNEAPQTFMPFTRMVNVADFKEISRTQLGDAPALLEVPENGQIEQGTIGEAAEKYSVKDYARIIAISRKVIINDDMSAFSRTPELMGRAARDLESDLVYDLIKANANMADGNPLFDAAHGNLGTAGAISATTIGEFRQLMRKQTGLNGRLLNTMLSWLIVPTPLETLAEQQTSSTQPNATNQVNPFGPQGRTPLMIVVEPRLDASAGGSDTRFYGAASVGQIDMIELAHLEGAEAPTIESREGFEVEGLEIKVRHTAGVKAIDWRGLLANNGV